MCRTGSIDSGIQTRCCSYWSRHFNVSRHSRLSVFCTLIACLQMKCLNNFAKIIVNIFRGPKGVWTLKKEGKSPQVNISFSEAIPTKCHMALKALLDSGHVKYIISQNIDGLHLRSGIQRSKIAELHGNMFIENCDKCRRFVRSFISSASKIF